MFSKVSVKQITLHENVNTTFFKKWFYHGTKIAKIDKISLLVLKTKLFARIRLFSMKNYKWSISNEMWILEKMISLTRVVNFNTLWKINSHLNLYCFTVLICDVGWLVKILPASIFFP